MPSQSEIANQIIALAKMLSNENTMSSAGSFQAPPPKGDKKNIKPVLRFLVEKRLERIKKVANHGIYKNR